VIVEAKTVSKSESAVDTPARNNTGPKLECRPPDPDHGGWRLFASTVRTSRWAVKTGEIAVTRRRPLRDATARAARNADERGRTSAPKRGNRTLKKFTTGDLLAICGVRE
jgi:alkanesulfonate monooxygenase SsuD/methylene tetrahydromethanopterin reductase-like flavin-dependent oxidoreductase (luciferase family)